MGASAGIAFMGINSATSGIMQASAMKNRADFQKQQYEQNAAFAELQAEDAIRRGDKEAAAAIRRGEQVVGEQRAGYAASGIDVNFGSARDIQEQTMQISESDARTIKNNAWREAWGFKTQAESARTSGRFARAGGYAEARNTMLTGFGEAAGYGIKAYQRSKER